MLAGLVVTEVCTYLREELNKGTSASSSISLWEKTAPPAPALKPVSLFPLLESLLPFELALEIRVSDSASK